MSKQYFWIHSTRRLLLTLRQSFFLQLEGTQPYGARYNPNTTALPFPAAVLNVVSNITETAVGSPNFFFADVFEESSSPSKRIYSLAQCWTDLPQESCRSCLYAAQLNITFGSTQLPNGARIYSMGCQLRYEIYQFFFTRTPSPPPPLSEGKKRNVFAITVGVVAATVGLIAAIGISRFRPKRWERISRTTGEISLSPSMANLELIFKYDTLRRATSDFKAENKLGEGGFGSVFKGVLPDGREVAIKRLNIGSRQGDNEFLNEANLITSVQHRNLVRLLGCSVQRSERSEIRIIHRDIKASNILLDDKYRPKIADFGLAKLFGEDESHVSTRVAGTLGYIAPESLRGHLTEKADVFSFGVLLLEIITGRKNHSLLQHMEFLIETTWRLYNAERALEVMDPTLEGSYSGEEGLRVIKIGLLCTQAGEEGLRVIKIGLLCTQAAATLRPSMSQAVSMLTGEQHHIPLPTRPAFVDEESVLAERGKVTPRGDPNNTSSNSQSLEVGRPSLVHSAGGNLSLTTMESR